MCAGEGLFDKSSGPTAWFFPRLLEMTTDHSPGWTCVPSALPPARHDAPTSAMRGPTARFLAQKSAPLRGRKRAGLPQRSDYGRSGTFPCRTTGTGTARASSKVRLRKKRHKKRRHTPSQGSSLPQRSDYGRSGTRGHGHDRPRHAELPQRSDYGRSGTVTGCGARIRTASFLKGPITEEAAHRGRRKTALDQPGFLKGPITEEAACL